MYSIGYGRHCVSILILTVLLVIMQRFRHVTTIVTYWNKCLPGSAGLRRYQMSKQACETECQARSDCQAVQYNRILQRCALLHAHDVTDLSTCNQVVYVAKENISHRLNSSSCSAGQKYNQNGTCAYTECDFPTIDHGTIEITGNMRRVGSTIRIQAQCDVDAQPLNPTLRDRTRYSTCRENGQFDLKDICAMPYRVWQVSTYGSGQAQLAVDGITKGNFFYASCTHTHISNSPWWVIDFGYPRKVNKVTIYLRTDCCYQRYYNMSILMSDDLSAINNNNFNGKLCDHYMGPPLRGTLTLDFNCTRSTSGRYLKIIAALSNLPSRQRSLSLCEVEFF